MLEARLQPDNATFRDVVRALDAEAGGEQLRAELASDFRGLLEEIVHEQRSGLMAMTSGGLPHAGEPLRTAISDRLTVDVRLSGRSAGARIRARRSGLPRKFGNAPKRTNAHQWRHRVHGMDVWVTQISGAQGWFDNPLDAGGARFRAAARRSLDGVAQRIGRSS